MKAKKIVYFNLTQAIDDKAKRFCYFRSSDVERKNYERLLWSVPDEMLFFLAFGKKVVVIDYSKKPKGKIERIFIPVLKDLLNFLWLRKAPEHKKLLNHFEVALETIKNNEKLARKFKFWREFVEREVKLEAKTRQIKREITKKELKKIMEGDRWN